MIKDVDKHNQRRVAIVYSTVPDEEHMALVMYTDSLPSMIHDEAMKVLESEVGQQAKELADALFRSTMADGTNCLTTIHKGGYLKKVPCNQVIVTPTALADMDANRGIRGVVQEGREVGQPAQPFTGAGALTDADLATQRTTQAEKLEAEAKVLLAEAKRLKQEATQLSQPKANNVGKSKKAAA